MSSCFSVRFWVAASGAALTLFGCATPQSTTVRADGRLRVSPQEFTSDVGCRFSSGEETELGHYVATLIDLGTEDVDTDGTGNARYPRVSGSGPAARCTSSTAFSTAPSNSLVDVGHLYVAIIDGYEGSNAPQVRRSRREGNWTAPRWQWVCGVGGLDESQVRTVLARVYDLPRLASPLTPNVPQPGGSTQDAGTSDGGTHTPVTTVDGNSIDGGNSEPSASADAAASTDVMTSGPDTDADREAADLGKLLQSAALDDQTEPTLLVAGVEAGVRGCVLLD